MRIGYWCVFLAWSLEALAAGRVVTLAGTGVDATDGDGGPALKAALGQPFGVVIGPDGALYTCEYSGHVIRRIDLATGVIETLAGTPRKAGYAGDGGDPRQAKFHQPHEIRFDTAGRLWVADMKAHAIRRIDPAARRVETIAGTGEAGFSGDGGPAKQAKLNQPHAVELFPNDDLLICDIGNQRVRHVNHATGVISTWAGTGARGPTAERGMRLEVSLNGPRTIALGAKQDVFVALREGNQLWRVDGGEGAMSRLAGTGKKGFVRSGLGKDSPLAGPKGLALDAEGNVYLADTESHTIRVWRVATGQLETLVGDGIAGDGPDGEPQGCRLNRPHGVFVAKNGDVYIGDSSNHKIRVYRP